MLPELCTQHGIVPDIIVDAGKLDLLNAPGDEITQAKNTPKNIDVYQLKNAKYFYKSFDMYCGSSTTRTWDQWYKS